MTDDLSHLSRSELEDRLKTERSVSFVYGSLFSDVHQATPRHRRALRSIEQIEARLAALDAK